MPGIAVVARQRQDASLGADNFGSMEQGCVEESEMEV